MQGLENLGSTCAINSLIQIICRTHYLRNIFLSDDIKQDTLSHELKEILNLMHNQKHSLSPKRFVNRLYTHMNGIFIQGEQIDIGELWMFLFDKLSTEQSIDDNIALPELVSTINIEHDNKSLSQSLELKNLCIHTIGKMNQQKTSKLLESCQGIILNIIKCNKCNKSIFNFEPFITIQLDLPEDNPTITSQLSQPTLAALFRNFLQANTHHDDWKCENCNECTSYTKMLKLWKLPPVLIFVVKRFANMTNKNTKPININRSICVKKGSVINQIESDYHYYCTSFALHYGNLSGGHYCAACTHEENIVLYDDLKMTILKKEDFSKIYENNNTAYMIVYSLNIH